MKGGIHCDKLLEYRFDVIRYVQALSNSTGLQLHESGRQICTRPNRIGRELQ